MKHHDHLVRSYPARSSPSEHGSLFDNPIGEALRDDPLGLKLDEKFETVRNSRLELEYNLLGISSSRLIVTLYYFYMHRIYRLDIYNCASWFLLKT